FKLPSALRREPPPLQGHTLKMIPHGALHCFSLEATGGGRSRLASGTTRHIKTLLKCCVLCAAISFRRQERQDGLQKADSGEVTGHALSTLFPDFQTKCWFTPGAGRLHLG